MLSKKSNDTLEMRLDLDEKYTNIGIQHEEDVIASRTKVALRSIQSKLDRLHCCKVEISSANFDRILDTNTLFLTRLFSHFGFSIFQAVRRSCGVCRIVFL